MPTKLTPEVINAAIVGFEQQKIRIDVQIGELRAMLDGGTKPTSEATPEVFKRKRRKMSAAARKRIGDAQRKRWAESKGEAELPSKAVTAKPKRRKMSAAGRKAISEATKRRWAAFHAAKTAPVVTKKATSKKAAAKKAPVKLAKKSASVKKAAVKKAATKTAPAAVEAGA